MNITKEMVDRFLSWKLPADFYPDAGISFAPGHTTPSSHGWPVGTNLLTATQAKAMLEHVLDGQPLKAEEEMRDAYDAADWYVREPGFRTPRQAMARQACEIEKLREQCAAWKEIAEHQYGLLRSEKYKDMDYPVTGALDTWAAGRHPVLTPNASLSGRGETDGTE